MMFNRVIILATAIACLMGGPTAAMDTAFSYQGRLSDAGAPASGDYDFQFIIYNAEIGGSQIGPIIYAEDVLVSDGFFTIYLDFGAGVFDGSGLWLEVAVRDGASTGSYTPLAPRNSIIPTPYALTSATVNWGGIAEMPPGFADGVDDDTTYAPGNQLDLTGDTFHVVEGAGSGLDADTLDGQHAESFSLSAHGHSGEVWTNAELVGLEVQTSHASGVGLLGRALGDPGTDTAGVGGTSASSQGIGVSGSASSLTGETAGVQGTTYSSEGKGVYGAAQATSGTTYGVYGASQSEDGRGVYGVNSSSSGTAAYGVHGVTHSGNSAGVYGYTQSSSTGVGVYGYSNSDGGIGVKGRNSESGIGVYGYSASEKGVVGEGGNVGGFDNAIGVYGETGSPGGAGGLFVNTAGGYLIAANNSDSMANLEFKVAGDGSVYSDGGYHCGVDFSCGLLDNCDEAELEPCLSDNEPADFAEMMPHAGEPIEAGDVLAIGMDGKLTLSSTAFDRRVAGVRSTRPSYLGNSRMEGVEGFAPLAIVGIVPVKVVAENGAIDPGDLLVTSNTVGHAMNGGDEPPLGTVIGKALDPHADGSGVIRMMVVMQ